MRRLARSHYVWYYLLITVIFFVVAELTDYYALNAAVRALGVWVYATLIWSYRGPMWMAVRSPRPTLDQKVIIGIVMIVAASLGLSGLVGYWRVAHPREALTTDFSTYLTFVQIVGAILVLSPAKVPTVELTRPSRGTVVRALGAGFAIMVIWLLFSWLTPG